ncbi:hypothetical protein HNQ80_003458 [Anaerosolibacter carboniphilus]|uniref:Uncharacterized protein n=1 Tax=Anaerosolibacter carboniphilus TaxID=1417629 RepID=A0A841L4K9_9FIRM|nr:hypothetical protein [Anaerosolibacter carboniphilus]MBB6217339.1 hypothetical protein [Anaerosolibacter carboniphilus]
METKYYKTWEQYVAEHPEIDKRLANVMAPKMQSYEEMMFAFVMMLLM